MCGFLIQFTILHIFNNSELYLINNNYVNRVMSLMIIIIIYYHILIYYFTTGDNLMQVFLLRIGAF